jgi:hypothetical protein
LIRNQPQLHAQIIGLSHRDILGKESLSFAPTIMSMQTVFEQNRTEYGSFRSQQYLIYIRNERKTCIFAKYVQVFLLKNLYANNNSQILPGFKYLIFSFEETLLYSLDKACKLYTEFMKKT